MTFVNPLIWKWNQLDKEERLFNLNRQTGRISIKEKIM
jgi:hypothetical protein